MTLPHFVYHPDPIATGALAETTMPCQCCGELRGWTISHHMYCADDVENICPWCVANGSAAAKFDGDFNDSMPLAQAGVDETIIETVSKRTPGYETWQQECWIACCNDACEFHGDASRESLLALNQDEMARLAQETDFPFDVLMDILKNYQPKGSPAFYRFVCRQCGTVHHNADFH